jgi:hypothetical protein
MQTERRWKAMIVPALKLLDFSGLLEYRAGEYFSLPSLDLDSEGDQVRGTRHCRNMM